MDNDQSLINLIVVAAGSDALQPIVGWDDRGSPTPLTYKEAQHSLKELQAKSKERRIHL